MSEKITGNRSLGRRLRDARKHAGIRQEEAAQLIGAVRTTLSAIENGLRDLCPDELALLSQAYGLEPYALLKGNHEEEVLDEMLDLCLKEWTLPQKRVLQRLLGQAPDEQFMQNVQMLCLAPSHMEAMACALLHLLAEREKGLKRGV